MKKTSNPSNLNFFQDVIQELMIDPMEILSLRAFVTEVQMTESHFPQNIMSVLLPNEMRHDERVVYFEYSGTPTGYESKTLLAQLQNPHDPNSLMYSYDFRPQPPIWPH